MVTKRGSAKETTLKARRRLSELYVRGVAVRFGPDGFEVGDGPGGIFVDDDGTPTECPEDMVEIWVTPPNPMQREEALREAQAARALALMKVRDKDAKSPDYLSAQSFINQMDMPTLVDYLVISDADSRRQEARREVLGEKEWEDVTALQDALRGFEERRAKGEDISEDEDYKAAMRQDARFGRQVAEREKELTQATRESLELLPRDRLESRALEKRGEMVASQSFMREYEKQMAFFSAREADDHDVLFFSDVYEYAEQPEQVQDGIAAALVGFINDGTEAKN